MHPTAWFLRPGLGGILTAALLYAASPGVDAWPLAFIALVPLMLVIEQASFRRALFEGALGGSLAYAAGLLWLPDSLILGSVTGSAGAWLAYALLVAISSARLCLTGAAAWLFIHAGVRPSVVFACSFAAGEIAVPGLVPYTIAAPLQSALPLVQIAEWGGSTWIVALLAAVNAGFARVLVGESWRDRTRALISIAMLLGGWVGVGLWLGERARTAVLQSNAPSRVLVVQPDISPNLKQTRPSHVVSLYRQATRRVLAQVRPDWVVWGETAMASPVEAARVEHTLNVRTQGGLGVPLLTGIAIRGPGGKLYNSAVSVDAAGRVCESCRYDKQRLVPLVEYLPTLKRTRGADASGTDSGTTRDAFEHGTHATYPMRIQGHPVAVAICYEALYPNEFRRQVSERQAELLVSLASDVWLTSERARSLHLALIRLRAIEHRKFLIHATIGATSASVQPSGDIHAIPSDGTTDVMVASVQWLQGPTLWACTGNLPFWTIFGLIALSRAPGWLRGRLHKWEPRVTFCVWHRRGP